MSEKEEHNNKRRYHNMIIKEELYKEIEEIRQKKNLNFDTHTIEMLVKFYKKKNRKQLEEDWRYNNSF